MRENTIGIIVVGIIILVGMGLFARWMTQPPPQPEALVQVYPQYHNREDFWNGYRDGWNGVRRMSFGAAYNRGFSLGERDRRRGCHDYYDSHFSGVHLKLPGFRLDVR